jgi:hypothetical protein
MEFQHCSKRQGERNSHRGTSVNTEHSGYTETANCGYKGRAGSVGSQVALLRTFHGTAPLGRGEVRESGAVRPRISGSVEGTVRRRHDRSCSLQAGSVLALGYGCDSKKNRVPSASICAVSRDVSIPDIITVSPSQTCHSHRSGFRATTFTSSKRDREDLAIR